MKGWKMTVIGILLILACFPGMIFPQEKGIRPVDPTLSEYEYPFVVQYLDPVVSEKVRETMGQYQELGKKTRDRIPDAELVELEGIGHLPPYRILRTFQYSLIGLPG